MHAKMRGCQEGRPALRRDDGQALLDATLWWHGTVDFRKGYLDAPDSRVTAAGAGVGLAGQGWHRDVVGRVGGFGRATGISSQCRESGDVPHCPNGRRGYHGSNCPGAVLACARGSRPRLSNLVDVTKAGSSGRSVFNKGKPRRTLQWISSGS
jgi:hypothetical protein